MNYQTIVILTIISLILNVIWLIYTTNFHKLIITKTIGVYQMAKNCTQEMHSKKGALKKMLGKKNKQLTGDKAVAYSKGKQAKRKGK